jgi:hypothetical protein
MAAPKRKPKAKDLVPAADPAPAPVMTVVDALTDPTLFAPWFPGDTWKGWIAILKAAFRLPMTEEEITFFKSVAGDRGLPEEIVRELWLIAGRRAGKDSIASAVAAFAAAMFNQQHRLRPGERGVVMCLAVDRDQAKIVLNYIRSYFTDIPLLKGMVQRETAEGFELTNNIDIVIATNNFRSVRGRAILLAIMDECAYWRDESSSKPDEELYKAITPALASLTPHSMIIALSSPYRKSGLLYKKYKKHFGREDDVLVIQAPTRALNPTIPQEIIDRELEEDPAGARAEWLAEFRDDIGGWLAVETIEAAVDRGVTVRPPATLHHTYVAGCDPSGGSGKDTFTAAIAHNDNGLAILDALIEIKPPFDPVAAVSQIAALLRSYGLTEVTGDRYAAEWVVSAFASAGITYRHSDRDRSAIYQDALPLFTSGRSRLLDNPKLVSQFASLERKTSTMGKDRIDHGPGGHDDLCNSAALAMVLATGPAKSGGLLFASMKF